MTADKLDLRRDRHVAEEIRAELARAGLDDIHDTSTLARAADAIADLDHKQVNINPNDRPIDRIDR